MLLRTGPHGEEEEGLGKARRLALEQRRRQRRRWEQRGERLEEGGGRIHQQDEEGWEEDLGNGARLVGRDVRTYSSLFPVKSLCAVTDLTNKKGGGGAWEKGGEWDKNGNWKSHGDWKEGEKGDCDSRCPLP